METKFNFKCPICGKTVRSTDVIRTMSGGRMCMHCYLKSQDDNANIKRREYEVGYKTGYLTAIEGATMWLFSNECDYLVAEEQERVKQFREYVMKYGYEDLR